MCKSSTTSSVYLAITSGWCTPYVQFITPQSRDGGQPKFFGLELSLNPEKEGRTCREEIFPLSAAVSWHQCNNSISNINNKYKTASVHWHSWVTGEANSEKASHLSTDGIIAVKHSNWWLLFVSDWPIFTGVISGSAASPKELLGLVGDRMPCLYQTNSTKTCLVNNSTKMTATAM